MKKAYNKLYFVIGIMAIIIFMLGSKVNAATFSITSSPSSVEPGGKFKISISSNGAGYVNLKGSNCTLEETYIWLNEGEVKFVNATAGSSEGKATVTADAVIGDFETAKDEEKKGSTSVEIKEKEVEVPVPVATPEPSAPATTSNPEPAKPTETKPAEAKPAETKTETQKPANNTTKTTPKKTEPTQPAPEPEKPAQEIIPAEEEQGTPSEFGITEMRIYGVLPEDAKVELKFTPQFDINQPVYSCKLTKEMVNINVEIQANEYKDLVKVESPDEIKEGGSR